MSELNFKDTLNLPKTDFQMKANLVAKEPGILEKWLQNDYYHKILKQKDINNKFILNDGPPYANGDIHIGHALNKILKDIIIKSKLLSGFYAPFVPGWDCHGLPIELEVEKKFGKAGVKLSAAEFRTKCREYAAEQIEKQAASFKRLGVLADWDNRYATMDYKFEADIIRVLAKIIENDHLIRGYKPVHWCLDCGSALADTEVEYHEKQSDSIYVLFKLVNQKLPKDLINLNLQNISVIIWTTTPWTLPANEAVCLNALQNYSIVAADNNNFIVATELLDTLQLELGWDHYKTLHTFVGKELEGLLLAHPFIDKQVPIVLGEHVTLDAGTGCVHTAPAHGYEDFVVGKKYNLPINNPVDESGVYIMNTPLVGGMHINKATTVILDEMKRLNVLFKHTQINHKYAYCWRHKKPLIFRATTQWFISMENALLREKALDAIKGVAWFPVWGESRIEKMLLARPDWCISRQRTWGTPLPLFVHKETGVLHKNTQQILEKVCATVEAGGISAWFDAAATDFISAEDAEHYSKVTDTLDVWFDSGAVHYAVAKSILKHNDPVDLYLEGSDQHRGWFQVSLLSSLAAEGRVPYKSVLTHGFTVDANGHKMSKSLKNIIAPLEVINKYGADVLRLWVSATDYSGDLTVGDEILNRIAEAYRRIRNTIRFLLANINDFNVATDIVAFEDLLQIDQWILCETAKMQTEVLKDYDNYQLHLIYHKVHNFCSNELGSFYLDIIKDRQYTAKADSLVRRSAQTAIYHMTMSLVKLLAPILSFTCDEVWSFLPHAEDDLLFSGIWYDINHVTHNAKQDQFVTKFSELIAIRTEVNKALETLRKDSVIGGSLDATVVLYCTDPIFKSLEKINAEIKFIFITSNAIIKPVAEKPAHIVESNIPGIYIDVSRADGEKCPRCWHYVSKLTEKNICNRCEDNVFNDGEKRIFA